jgi:hypothetical protein
MAVRACDFRLMVPPDQKPAQSNRKKTKSSEEAGERTICALCGRVMNAGRENTPVIYSICAPCKQPARRNGSALSRS